VALPLVCHRRQHTTGVGIRQTLHVDLHAEGRSGGGGGGSSEKRRALGNGPILARAYQIRRLKPAADIPSLLMNFNKLIGYSEADIA
jgi:hypothetical protein